MDKILASIALRGKKAAEAEETSTPAAEPAPAATTALPPRNAMLAAIAARAGSNNSELSDVTPSKPAAGGAPPRSALFAAITSRADNNDTTAAPPTGVEGGNKPDAAKVAPSVGGSKKKRVEKEKGAIDLFPEDVTAAFHAFSRHTDTITAEDLNEAYHNQYHTVKGINEENLQMALNRFCEELLPPSKKGGKKEIEEIDLATFLKGVEKANVLLEEADNTEEIIHEFEKICLDLANDDPGQFAELLGLSPALLVGDIRSLMDAMKADE